MSLIFRISHIYHCILIELNLPSN
ncbi:rCG27478, partial [Rattus norvegicus]